jgi:Sulfotransferase domain
MSIKVVGAGVGRTGTLSLKAALERLTGEPCYHMLEVFEHPEHVGAWREAAEGKAVDWAKLLDGYGATSDFPACLFWQEILGANPDAVVVLSTRADSETWWQSASQTIFSLDASQLPPEMGEWFEMWRVVAMARFTPDWTDKEAAIAAYERHNRNVRESVPASRLVEWQAGDGWRPLCDALNLDEPLESFPHLNKREDFPHPDADTSLPEAIERMRKE